MEDSLEPTRNHGKYARISRRPSFSKAASGLRLRLAKPSRVGLRVQSPDSFCTGFKDTRVDRTKAEAATEVFKRRMEMAGKQHSCASFRRTDAGRLQNLGGRTVEAWDTKEPNF